MSFPNFRISFEVVSRAGIKHDAVDTILRLTTNGEDKSPLEDDILQLAIDAHTLENITTNDDNVASPHSFQPPKRTEFLCE